MLNRTILETVRSCGRTFGRLRRDRRGVAAVIVAVTLPLTITAIGAAVDVAWLQVRSSELQDVADSAATAARNKLDPFQPYYQQPATDEAERIASLNDPSTAVAQADVVQGWWDITKANDDPTKFGPPIAGQTGSPFSNAVRVTARKDHKTIFGSILGLTDVALSKTGTGYKCSNLDYPLTLIQNDVPTPALPAIYMSWATPGHADNTSYYYQQPNGDRNPIFKFYSPYDGQDVSFVLTMSNGYELQVDTYCAGTYLVSPAAFRVQDFVDSSGHPCNDHGCGSARQHEQQLCGLSQSVALSIRHHADPVLHGQFRPDAAI